MGMRKTIGAIPFSLDAKLVGHVNLFVIFSVGQRLRATGWHVNAKIELAKHNRVLVPTQTPRRETQVDGRLLLPSVMLATAKGTRRRRQLKL